MASGVGVILDGRHKRVGVVAEVLHGEAAHIRGPPFRVLCESCEEVLDGGCAPRLGLPGDQHLELLALHAVWNVGVRLLCVLDILHTCREFDWREGGFD